MPTFRDAILNGANSITMTTPHQIQRQRKLELNGIAKQYSIEAVNAVNFLSQVITLHEQGENG